MPILNAIKDFFGIYELTPLEKDLLTALRDGLSPEYQEILKTQTSKFNVVRRLVKYLDAPASHGYTNFHVVRKGVEVSEEAQSARFPEEPSNGKFATARVVFDGGEIFVEFWLAKGIFFRMKYSSPQKIWYPPDGYRVLELNVSALVES